MADIELVIKIDKETLQDLYDSRYVSPHIKEVFRSATLLPEGHGDLIDINNIKVIELEDSLHIIRHEKGDEIDVHIDAPIIIESEE